MRGLPSFVIVTGPLTSNPPVICASVPSAIAIWCVCCIRPLEPDVLSTFVELRV